MQIVKAEFFLDTKRNRLTNEAIQLGLLLKPVYASNGSGAISYYSLINMRDDIEVSRSRTLKQVSQFIEMRKNNE